MQDIDFLPLEYHRKHARRQSQPWRIVVVSAFVSLVAAAAFAQYQANRQAQARLDALGPRYDQAVAQQTELAKVQAELKTAQGDAELVTYLRHPWPRTQLLAALIDPLPREVTLDEVQVIHEELPQKPSGEEQPRRRGRAAQTKKETLPPAVADLQRLRKAFDQSATVVMVSGTTSNSVALHRYLGALGRHSLFAKAELESSESVEGDDKGTEQFQARLLVEPGYGQPGGPERGDEDTEQPGEASQDALAGV